MSDVIECEKRVKQSKRKRNKQRKIKDQSPELFSEHFGISEEKLRELGVFNLILNYDTEIFVDPILLSRSSSKIICGAYDVFRSYFLEIIVLLKNSNLVDDECWGKAEKLALFNEYQSTCIGYSNSSVRGKGIGLKITSIMYRKIKEICTSSKNLYIESLAFLPLITKGISSDRISDITQNIIDNDICRYTVDVMKNLNIKGDFNYTTKCNKKYFLLKNPYFNCPIKLLPLDILTDTPLSKKFSKWLKNSIKTNADLRGKISEIIGDNWKTCVKNNIDSNNIISLFYENTRLLIMLLSNFIQTSTPEKYDFEQDKKGLHKWVKNSKKFFVDEYEINLSDDIADSLDTLYINILSIINSLKLQAEQDEFFIYFWARLGEEFVSYNISYIYKIFHFAISFKGFSIKNVRYITDSNNILEFSIYEKYFVSVVFVKSNRKNLEMYYRDFLSQFNGEFWKGIFVVMDSEILITKELKKIRDIKSDFCKLIEIDLRDKQSVKYFIDSNNIDLAILENIACKEESSKYLDEKVKGGLNSYKYNKPLKEKVCEIAEALLNTENIPSANQLSIKIKNTLEKDHIVLLENFAPYQNANGDNGDGSDWTKPSLYSWCNKIYKEAKKEKSL